MEERMTIVSLRPRRGHFSRASLSPVLVVICLAASYTLLVPSSENDRPAFVSVSAGPGMRALFATLRSRLRWGRPRDGNRSRSSERAHLCRYVGDLGYNVTHGVVLVDLVFCFVLLVDVLRLVRVSRFPLSPKRLVRFPFFFFADLGYPKMSVLRI